MSGIEGVGNRVRLRPEDDEDSRAIVERDTKVTLSGTDKSWRQEKTEQTEHMPWLALGLHGGHAAVEGLDGAEALFGGGMFAGVAVGALAVGGLVLGGAELHEAHEKADAQKAALAKDNARAALVASLELPTGYKGMRLECDLKHVGKGPRSEAFKMTEAIAADPKGRALLQLHADRGMNAARDCMASGVSVKGFLEANAKVAEQYAKDPAFKEGFDAFVHTTKHGTTKETDEMNRKLDERDGWHAADHVAIRV